jgi:hypothetical protein
LICRRGSRSDDVSSTGSSLGAIQFAFDFANLILERSDARLKFSLAMLEHAFFLVPNYVALSTKKLKPTRGLSAASKNERPDVSRALCLLLLLAFCVRLLAMLARILGMLLSICRMLFSLAVVALAMTFGRGAMGFSGIFVMFRSFVVLVFGHSNTP